MDNNRDHPTYDNVSEDHHCIKLVVPKEITSITSSISKQITNQQQRSLQQNDTNPNDAGNYQSRKKVTLYPNWFRKRKKKGKKNHEVKNTLEAFVEVGLAPVIGNNVLDIYEVV